jgi:hypothetical protein
MPLRTVSTPTASAAYDDPAPSMEEVEAETAPMAQEGQSLIPGKRGPGRPRKGITLLVGCRHTVGGAVRPTLLSSIVADIIQRIEDEPANLKNGKRVSFWALDPFKRRDALLSHVRQFAEDFSAGEIVCDVSRTIEHAYFLEALRACPEVNDVFEGISF